MLFAPYSSIAVLFAPYSSIAVFFAPYSSIAVLFAPYSSIAVFFAPYSSIAVLFAPYSSIAVLFADPVPVWYPAAAVTGVYDRQPDLDKPARGHTLVPGIWGYVDGPFLTRHIIQSLSLPDIKDILNTNESFLDLKLPTSQPFLGKAGCNLVI